VKSYKKTLSDKLISETISMSLRCDGSVDRSQIDKMYVIIKTVSEKTSGPTFLIQYLSRYMKLNKLI